MASALTKSTDLVSMELPSSKHEELLESLPVKQSNLPFICDDLIPFYGEKYKLYGCFSNFSQTSFTVPTNTFGLSELEKIFGDTLTFHNSEQCFMFLKGITFYDRNPKYNLNIIKQILNGFIPYHIKNLGRKLDCTDKSGKFDIHTWERERCKCMYNACYWKFSQNEGIKNILLNTHDQYLVEATKNDTVWGNGLHIKDKDLSKPHKWKGTNLLGEVLMILRDDLRS